MTQTGGRLKGGAGGLLGDEKLMRDGQATKVKVSFVPAYNERPLLGVDLTVSNDRLGRRADNPREDTGVLRQQANAQAF